MMNTRRSIPKRCSFGAFKKRSPLAKTCRYLSFWVPLCLVFVAPLSAKEFMAPMDRSQWYISASIFECTVVHDIPLYGKATFYHEAGEPLSFYTSTIRNPMRAGQAALVIEASSWKPGLPVQDLGYVSVSDSNRPLLVEAKRATSMMYGLLEGMAPTFTRQAQYKQDESVRVRLNSINFKSVYDAYLECVAGLLPVNFRQVERTRVHFQVDKAELTDDDRAALDRVALYVLADSTVTGIFVDGHTDSSGRRMYNRFLSKQRAEVVTEYLVNKGLDSSIILTRYHGDRYPVIDNRTKANKAQNRRTTVRLQRGGEIVSEDEDG